ncbi:Ndr [Cynara cardunculus var. scolymus]|uniref:Ndr n=1 Tax=Cynara cardunculus var. scolymus TaxID=59895 RepID=A0A103Y2C4_CYNCS|nr:Ndr [Cynara cardunculus var. scolymus]
MAMAHSGDSIAVDMPNHLIEKTLLVSGAYSSVLNQLHCYSTISAFITLLHLLGAASISIDDSVPTVEDFSDQILEVLNHFRLGSVMCMGAMAGAYVLTLFALKYSERVTGLILVSPLCRAPTWNEWFYNKFMSNLLYYYGMSDLLKEFLLHRYFSKEACGSLQVPESDIVRSCRKLLDERNSINVWRRPDLTEELENLECRTIIFVGDSSPFHAEALHMTAKLGRKCCALVEGFGLYRSCWFNNGHRSCLGPSCIKPELLSPQSMGVKLKRIKTRVSPPPPRTQQS